MKTSHKGKSSKPDEDIDNNNDINKGDDDLGDGAAPGDDAELCFMRSAPVVQTFPLQCM